MHEARTDLVELRHTFGTLAKEFGTRPVSRGPSATGDDPRFQLGQTLEALYAALNELHQGRPLPLQQLWSSAPDVAPVGLPAETAAGPDGRTVVAEDVAITLCAEAAWAVCKERTTTPGANGSESAESLHQSTNIFRRESGAWRLVHRHVGPVD